MTTAINSQKKIQVISLVLAFLLLGLLLAYTLWHQNKNNNEQSQNESPDVVGFDGVTKFADPMQTLNAVLPDLKRYAQSVGDIDYKFYGAYVQNTSDTNFSNGKSIVWNAEFLNPNNPDPQPLVLTWSGLSNQIYSTAQPPLILTQPSILSIAEEVNNSQDVLTDFQILGQDCTTLFGVWVKDGQITWTCTSGNGQTQTILDADTTIRE